MAPNIRDAEKARTGTCPFADRIAGKAIAEYHAHAEHALFSEYQTVLSAFLVHDTIQDELQVPSNPSISSQNTSVTTSNMLYFMCAFMHSRGISFCPTL